MPLTCLMSSIAMVFATNPPRSRYNAQVLFMQDQWLPYLRDAHASAYLSSTVNGPSHLDAVYTPVNPHTARCTLCLPLTCPFGRCLLAYQILGAIPPDSTQCNSLTSCNSLAQCSSHCGTKWHSILAQQRSQCSQCSNQWVCHSILARASGLTLVLR